MTVPGTFRTKPDRPVRDLSPRAEQITDSIERLGALRAEIWHVGEVRVVCAREPIPGGGYRWHVSISHPSRYPTWDEMKTTAYAIPSITLEPGRTFAQLFGDPAAGPWVDVHPTTLHLYEIDNPRIGDRR